jgi:Tfp pilus assembly protein PilO
VKIVVPQIIKKFTVPSIATAIVLVCLIIFLLRFSLVVELREEIKETEYKVRTMQRNIKNSVNLPAQLEQIELATDRIKSRIVEPEDTAVNTAYFYQFETGGVKIETVEQRISEGPQKAGPWKMSNFGTTLFTIRAVGNFRQILDFAYRIRGGEKLVRLINVSITPAEGSGEKQRRISMTIEALSTLPEPAKKK